LAIYYYSLAEYTAKISELNSLRNATSFSAISVPITFDFSSEHLQIAKPDFLLIYDKVGNLPSILDSEVPSNYSSVIEAGTKYPPSKVL
jgi:hypothetical protein